MFRLGWISPEVHNLETILSTLMELPKKLVGCHFGQKLSLVGIIWLDFGGDKMSANWPKKLSYQKT